MTASRFGTLAGIASIATLLAFFATSSEISSRLDHDLGVQLKELATLEGALLDELDGVLAGKDTSEDLQESIERIARVSMDLDEYVTTRYGAGEAGVNTSMRALSAVSQKLNGQVQDMLAEERRVSDAARRFARNLARLQTESPSNWSSDEVIEFLSTSHLAASRPESPAAREFERALDDTREPDESGELVADLHSWLMTARMASKARRAIIDRPFTRARDELLDQCLEIEARANQETARRRRAFEALLFLVAATFGILWVRESWRGQVVVATAREEARGLRNLLDQREAEVERDQHRWKRIEDLLQRPEQLEAAGPPSSESSVSPVMAPADAVDLTGMRVLLAEDGPDNQRLILYLLGRTGAESTAVTDGRAAVQEAMAAWSAGAPYDLILMDMGMPLMDGFEATSELRAAGYTAPIVAVTAFGQPDYRTRCFEVGCTEFLAKPFDVGEFVATLQRFDPGAATLAQQPQPEAPLPQAPGPAVAAAPGAVAVDSVQTEPEPVLPSGPILSEYAHDETMSELIEWFVRDLQDDLIRLQRSLDQGDMEHLAVVAHQLKGSAGSYGFPSITTQAELLETSLRANGSGDEIRESVLSFVELCSRVRARV